MITRIEIGIIRKDVDRHRGIFIGDIGIRIRHGGIFNTVDGHRHRGGVGSTLAVGNRVVERDRSAFSSIEVVEVFSRIENQLIRGIQCHASGLRLVESSDHQRIARVGIRVVGQRVDHQNGALISGPRVIHRIGSIVCTVHGHRHRFDSAGIRHVGKGRRRAFTDSQAVEIRSRREREIAGIVHNDSVIRINRLRHCDNCQGIVAGIGITVVGQNVDRNRCVLARDVGIRIRHGGIFCAVDCHRHGSSISSPVSVGDRVVESHRRGFSCVKVIKVVSRIEYDLA